MTVSLSDDPYKKNQSRPGISDPRIVRDFHQNDDNDTDRLSHHHTIGPGSTQAASGSHSHDGVDSRQLLAGVNLTGSKGGNVALASVCAALVLLGATDSTT